MAVKGKKASLEFFTGYIVEQSLSVDNLFIFIMLFDYFKVPEEFQVWPRWFLTTVVFVTLVFSPCTATPIYLCDYSFQVVPLCHALFMYRVFLLVLFRLAIPSRFLRFYGEKLKCNVLSYSGWSAHALLPPFLWEP